MKDLKIIEFMKAMNRFNKACVALSWMGAQMPEMHQQIEEEYKNAKTHLENLYIKLYKEKNHVS